MVLALLACKQGSADSTGSDARGAEAPSAASVAAPAPPIPQSPAKLSVKGSCNNARQGFCNDFTGESYTRDQVEAACRAQKVEFSGEPCPAEGRVGTCLTRTGDPLESYYRYYSAFTGGQPAAEKQCTGLLKGEWTADP